MKALDDALTKAAVLAEALPYIRRFQDRTVVVKYGGNAMEDQASLELLAQDIVLMSSVGMRPVLVHGGGPQIGELLGRLGKVSEFRDGLRVTDAETLDVARMVLVGKVNRDIVGAINVHAPIAVGLSGEDAGLIRATARSAELGFVGDVAGVDASIVERLLAEDLIPVVATIGSDVSGQAYNINADTAAGALAAALGAEKLVYLTNIEGLMADVTDPDSLLRSVTVGQLRSMLDQGRVEGGMIPKIASCAAAVEAGVARAHILDGRLPHALLLEFFTDEGVGTMVTP
ncbi:MAG TPA: acetylglutamate kinase [Acidimicrobiales bacterium]|nr:acetylglutamate kinase [Acidimicrobiales bacterium]